MDTTFEVDDGTGMARVKLRDLDSGEIAFQGIDPHLFAPPRSTSGCCPGDIRFYAAG